MEKEVFVLRLIPGMDTAVLGYLRQHCRALVIEGFGVGGVPGYGGGAFLRALKGWTDCGKLVVFTTQVPHEGSDLGVYAVGSAAKKIDGVIETSNMTLEAAVTKLMYPGPDPDRTEAARLFLTPICSDTF